MIATARRLNCSRTRDAAIAPPARVKSTVDEVRDVNHDLVSSDDDPLATDPDADAPGFDETPEFGDEGADMPVDISTEAGMLAHLNQASQPSTDDATLPRDQVQSGDADPEEWLTSDALKHYIREGCHDERNRDFRPPSPPLWLCDFLGSREKADVLAAIIFWFGKSKRTNQPMARHRDRRGRRYIYKKQDEIANEAGISGSRRRETIGRYLKEFEELGLLEYDADGRQTTIWLIPSGIQRAYDSVSHHQE